MVASICPHSAALGRGTRLCGLRDTLPISGSAAAGRALHRAPLGRAGRQLAHLWSPDSRPGCTAYLSSRAGCKAFRSAAAASAQSGNAETLDTEFGIPGSVAVAAGENGNPKVVLTHECGAAAEIYLFGACITSWKQISGDEVLYMRPDAVFDKSKPISGGVPHCFPQFGPGKMQQHGFARNLDWEISSTSADLQPDEKDPEVELVLADNDYTRQMWDHPFKLVYSVRLHGEELKTEYRVINSGNEPFEFTAALHSYFEVLSIDVASIKGLHGLTYLDKVEDKEAPPSKTQNKELVTFSGATDSVYLSAPEYVELDVGTGAAIAITSTGWEDCVIWNPWGDMPDFYERFCCVENARVSNPVTVLPGESWGSQTEFRVIDL